LSACRALAGYRQLFSAIAGDAHTPAVFHCTTGKDRTGWAAASTLLLGGSNIAAQNGQTYDSWVTGYDTTASISLVGQANWNSGAVQTSISAVQTDGSVNTYYGTYYVTNGVITSANIAQTS
jgi:hypothetical protein